MQDWLTGSDDEFGVRDEGLLKLFFGAALDTAELAELVRRRRTFFEEVAAHFRGIGEELGPIDNPSAEVLAYGIELMDWNAAWWAALGRGSVPGLMGCHPVRGDTPAVQVRASHSAAVAAAKVPCSSKSLTGAVIGTPSGSTNTISASNATWPAPGGPPASVPPPGPVTVTNAGSPSDVPSG